MDNQQGIGEGLRELALFAGAGGGILGGLLLGWRTVCAVEYEPHAAAVLCQRQNDGILQPFPIWDDVRTFNGKPWQGRVDVVSGGFPCQDISCAGSGKGLAGERSGLWSEFARIVSEVRPRYVFVENSPMLTSRGLGVVLGDLAEMGYNAKWGVLGSHHVGICSKRDRLWIVASTTEEFRRKLFRWSNQKSGNMAKHESTGSQVNRFLERLDKEGEQRKAQRESDLPPYLFKLVDGMAIELDELKRAGNGQVPAVAALAWRILSGRAE